LARRIDLVDGMGGQGGAARGPDRHQQRMHDASARGVEALDEPCLAIIVHQEADRAAMHAIDRLRAAPEPFQGLQHDAVPAERHDHAGVLDGAIAVSCGEILPRRLRGLGLGGDEGDAPDPPGVASSL
jgi:hypothetical protein